MDTTTGTLFEQILSAARVEYDRVEAGKNLISRDECPAELSPIGHLRWYIHSQLATPSTRALYVCELEIPPGSRGGKLFCQGGIVHFVVEGSGYTVVEDEPHEWEAHDLIGIPLRERGITFQHFNTGSGRARMLVAWPNLDSAIGPGGGVEIDVVEACPEFAAAEATGDS